MAELMKVAGMATPIQRSIMSEKFRTSRRTISLTIVPKKCDQIVFFKVLVKKIVKHICLQIFFLTFVTV